MDDSAKLNRLFFALSDPSRRDILTRLVNGDALMGDLAKNYEMSLPAISKHVRVLEEAELVSITTQGRSRRLSILAENFQLAQIWLATLSDETVVFDRLEAHIEALLDSE